MSTFGVWDLLKWVGKYLRPYRFMGLVLFAGLLLNQAFESFLPYTFKFILDDAIVPRNTTLLLYLLIGMGAGAVLFSVIAFLLDLLYAHVGNSILMDLRAEMFQQIQSMDMKSQARMPKGEVLSRFSSDMEAVENIVVTMLPGAIVSLFGMIFGAVMLLSLEWRMAAVALVGIALNILAMRYLQKPASESNMAKKAGLAELITLLEESLRARCVICGFNLKPFMISKYSSRLKQFYRVSMRADQTCYVMERIPNVGMLLITVIVIAMGAVMTFKGIISIGTLVAFQALMAGSSAAVYGLTSVLPFLVDATTSARRIEEVLSATSEVVDRSEANPLPRVASEIRFRNVSFGYSHAQRVVENINLQIRHGWSVALVGPSGCGKSTILNLVQRFYDPDRGAVLIDGQDIREVRQQDLHARISAVFQDNFLFNLSISDNIRMGKLDASDEEIIAAAKLAEAHDFIVELGEGYQTMAGDQGSHLSGGQRQRIAIARAIIRDPAILVLDEATSALDPATEASISKTIEKLRPGRTIICVTHRLSPIVNCDRIYVFEKGRLVESGSHAELLNAKNLYARLWEKQSGFTIDDEGLVTVTPQRLRQIPLLSMLDERQLAKLSRFLVSEKFAEGREIIRQNEEGDKFYLIVRGRAMVKYCDVAGRETLLATLCDGDHFGEIALLRNIPRTASVISQTPLIALSLARQPFHALLDQSPRLKEKLAQDVVNRIMVNDLLANCSPASPAEAPAASQPIYAGA